MEDPDTSQNVHQMLFNKTLIQWEDRDEDSLCSKQLFDKYSIEVACNNFRRTLYGVVENLNSNVYAEFDKENQKFRVIINRNAIKPVENQIFSNIQEKAIESLKHSNNYRYEVDAQEILLNLTQTPWEERNKGRQLVTSNLYDNTKKDQVFNKFKKLLYNSIKNPEKNIYLSESQKEPGMYRVVVSHSAIKILHENHNPYNEIEPDFVGKIVNPVQHKVIKSKRETGVITPGIITEDNLKNLPAYIHTLVERNMVDDFPSLQIFNRLFQIKKVEKNENKLGIYTITFCNPLVSKEDLSIAIKEQDIHKILEMAKDLEL